MLEKADNGISGVLYYVSIKIQELTLSAIYCRVKDIALPKAYLSCYKNIIYSARQYLIDCTCGNALI